jgi:hypothetical protein
MARQRDEVAAAVPICRRAAAVRAGVLLAMCLAMVIVQIDTSVVNLRRRD